MPSAAASAPTLFSICAEVADFASPVVLEPSVEPPALKARRTFDWALRTGLVRRWRCFAGCGRKAEPHWRDPGHPLAVVWYCPRCWRLDRKERALAAEHRARDSAALAARIAYGTLLLASMAELSAHPDLASRLEAKVRERWPILREVDASAPLFRQRLMAAMREEPAFAEFFSARDRIADIRTA